MMSTCMSPPKGSLLGADQVFLGEEGGRADMLGEGPDSAREPCSLDSWGTGESMWSHNW